MSLRWLRTVFTILSISTIACGELDTSSQAGGLTIPANARISPARIERISVSSSEEEANSGSTEGNASDDGRYAVFASHADNLVAGDTNGFEDVFLRDRRTGTTTLISVGDCSAQANARSTAPLISGDGRFVVFASEATNLIAGDTNGARDIFVRDLEAETTTRVSVDSNGVEADGASEKASISADGALVAFESAASNLDSEADVTPFELDIFVHNRRSGTTTRVSESSAGVPANAFSAAPAIAANGRFVAFWSFASNLVAGDTNGKDDVFVHDLQTGITERVSVSSGGDEANGFSFNHMTAISGDGRFVAFTSNARNLVPNDTSAGDTFVRDRRLGTTRRVSISDNGDEGNGFSGVGSMSRDGRYVVFDSLASNLVEGDTNDAPDIFVYDLRGSRIAMVSRTGIRSPANHHSFLGAISGDGRHIFFSSLADNFVPDDTNGELDVFAAPNPFLPNGQKTPMLSQTRQSRRSR